MRKVVRALQKRPAVRQADMLQHALRIAVILNEIQEVGALGQSATLIRVWSCFRAALFVLCLLCCCFCKGAKATMMNMTHSRS